MGVAVESTDPTRPSGTMVWSVRLLYLLAAVSCWLFSPQLQTVVDNLWLNLLQSWIFNSVYFETWWATVVYAILLAFPFIAAKISYFNRYKIDKGMDWHDAGTKTILLETVVYCTPFMLLDTFMVKCYVGVDASEVTERRKSWIQYTRPLPLEAPSVFEIVYQLFFTFIFYDLMFYCVHRVCHRSMFLYKHVHADHHAHDVIHSRVTNQLTVFERIILVLSANQALKFLHSHPLTRTLFVPLFVGWLIENHCGYDLPWTLDKVVPFKLVGGSRYHYDHHAHCSQNYQPFFTYIDKWMNRKPVKMD